MSETTEKRELVLPPGSYAYFQDSTKGLIKTYVGPHTINQNTQDFPVTYEPKTGTFRRCRLDEAVHLNPIAVEGYYVTLLNPATKDVHPDTGRQSDTPELRIGRKVNIPGPVDFALWPGQAAKVIRGHQLRSNEYLLARVYNEEEARQNWDKSIIKSTSSTLTPPAETATAEEKAAYVKALEEEKKLMAENRKAPKDLAVGQQFIIKGTDVSFYIPPTGVTVIEDGVDAAGKPVYVRDALTLERLEYCILVDENGRKRYEHGPKVVFPLPSERFVMSKDGGEPTKKFRAIELNELQGIHVKVIAEYEDGNKKYAAGEELFITGKEMAIYYPREEHSAIKYDGKTKHFATAVPAGEARYVMDRSTGEINKVIGPAMLLPDPRTQVIVRRILTEKQAALWYPGNAEVAEYNRSIRSLVANAPTTRTGTVTEGEMKRGGARTAQYLSADVSAMVGSPLLNSRAASAMMESSNVSKEQDVAGAEFSRASTYTAPRSITLETKFQGVPTIELWSNYAAMVISKGAKANNRRVEVGPKTLLLDYDETLEVLELSTGKPKTTEKLLRTVYLRVENNKVADVVQVETSDHVQVELRLSYVINFEGQDKEKWFSVENYVKFLCDHVRSALKGAVRQKTIEEFYSNSTAIVQEIILGKDRKGMFFEANNMRLADVEVLGSSIQDSRVRELLDTSQFLVVKSNTEINNLRRNFTIMKEKETITRNEATARAETLKLQNEMEEEIIISKLSLSLKRLSGALEEEAKRKELEALKQEIEAQGLTAHLENERRTQTQAQELKKTELQQRIELLKAETESTIQRFQAVDGNFTAALTALSNNDTLIKAAQAWSFQSVVGGENISDALQKVFAGTPIAGLVKQITQNAVIEQNGKSKGNGSTIGA